MAHGCFVNFHCALLGCSLFAQINLSRTIHSRCSRCLGSLVAIQNRVREITNNRFELLFIYIGTVKSSITSIYKRGGIFTSGYIYWPPYCTISDVTVVTSI